MDTSPLTIGIDARYLGESFTSNRTYWVELVRALISREDDCRYILFTDRRLPAGALPEGQRWKEVVLSAKSSRVWSLVRFPLACKRLHAHVAHMQYTVSPLFTIPTVTTIHDVSYFINPEWFSTKDRTLLRASVPASCKRAKRVIAVSETCRKEILQYIPMPEEKVMATPLGVPNGMHPVDKAEAREWAAGALGVTSPFVLCVGGLQPRKNWRLVFDAVAEARRELDSDLHLVMTGRVRDDEERVNAGVREVGGQDWIHFPGGVADANMPTLYSAATALIHPSLHEGFGLTPLEAFACGTPVIASNRGAIPEVAGDAAILLEPVSPQVWAAAIVGVLRGTAAEELSSRGLERAGHFSWVDTANRTVRAYREAANS